MRFEEPLQWNPSIPRTKNPQRSRFGDRSTYRAGEELSKELQLMGAKNIIISSNLRIKLTGGFYANQNKIEDAGVCIYFDLKGEPKCFACDKWDKPEDNMWALKLNVSAMRGMERWGGSNFMDGLFTGFAALPSPEDIINTSIRYFDDCVSLSHAKERYKDLAKQLHPDVGGNPEEFNEMMRQYKQLKR